MTFIAKPKLHHPKLPINALGLTRRDYEGAVSTLCAGCGHDSISAAIVHDQQFKIRKGLGQEAVHGGSKEFFPVPHGHDDGNAGGHFSWPA